MARVININDYREPTPRPRLSDSELLSVPSLTFYGEIAARLRELAEDLRGDNDDEPSDRPLPQAREAV
jgi:hypothetical protein